MLHIYPADGQHVLSVQYIDAMPTPGPFAAGCIGQKLQCQKRRRLTAPDYILIELPRSKLVTQKDDRSGTMEQVLRQGRGHVISCRYWVSGNLLRTTGVWICHEAQRKLSKGQFWGPYPPWLYVSLRMCKA